MSNILDCIPIGEQVDVQGPMGENVYHGHGKFEIEGKERRFNKISLVLGGSGLTPGFALIGRVVATTDQDVEVRVVDANKSEKDILLREEFDRYDKEGKGRVKITHVLSHPSDEWKGLKGYVNADIIKKSLFSPGEESVVFLCGPPGMIQKAALPALKGTSVIPLFMLILYMLTGEQTGVMSRMRTCLVSRYLNLEFIVCYRITVVAIYGTRVPGIKIESSPPGGSLARSENVGLVDDVCYVEESFLLTASQSISESRDSIFGP